MFTLTATRNLLAVGLLAVGASLALSSTGPAAVAAPSARAEIEALLREYERALNASDVDGVFMAQHDPSAVGIGQIEAAYTAVFRAIDLNVEFAIVEVDVIAQDWAFARTNSSGTTTINATGDEVAEGNQELFVLKKIDGNWKIARYSFSTTNPR